MKLFKKAFAFVTLVCLLTAIGATVLAESYNFTLVKNAQNQTGIAAAEEAESIAVKTLEESGLVMDFAIDEIKTTLVQNDKGELIWFVSIFPSEGILDVHWVQIDAKTGSIINAQANDNYGNVLEQWQILKGFISFWSLEDQALFDKLFRSSLTMPTNVLPEAGDISPEKAISIGNDALKSTFNLTDEQVSALTVSTSMWWGYEDFSYENRDERVWVLGFHDLAAERHLLYGVYISATTGEVLNVSDNSAGNG